MSLKGSTGVRSINKCIGINIEYLFGINLEYFRVPQTIEHDCQVARAIEVLDASISCGHVVWGRIGEEAGQLNKYKGYIRPSDDCWI